MDVVHIIAYAELTLCFMLSGCIGAILVVDEEEFSNFSRYSLMAFLFVIATVLYNSAQLHLGVI